MSWERYTVKPLPVFDGQIPIRKELNDLSDKEKFLYLEGMSRFQDVPMKDPLSYYQIAGIHGLPQETWPLFEDPATGKNFDTGIKKAADVENDKGFCTHSSVLFLSWHRPYLVLFESALYKHVNDVANEIDGEDRTAYQKLARNFRMPYWDWAKKNVDHFPRIALEKEATPAFSDNFNPPTIAGKPAQAILNNPIFAYKFPDGCLDKLRQISVETGSGKKDKDGNDETEVVEYKSTQRYVKYNKPSAPDKVITNFRDFFLNQEWKRKPKTSGPDDPGEKFRIDEIPDGSRPRERNLSERTAYLLKSYKRYGPVSYNAKSQFEGDVPADTPDISKAEAWGSLEDIHNAIHNYAGGGGHMSQVPKSAFDPIFWLHHANIDRLFTIWQALHESDEPTAYVEERPVYKATYAKEKGFKENKFTPLWPFRKTVGGQGNTPWWNSQDSRRTEPFGYSYEETRDWQYPGTSAARAQLIRKIDTMYTNFPSIVRESVLDIPTAGQELLPQAEFLRKLAAEKQNVSITTESAEPVREIKLMQQIDANLPPAETLLELYSGEDEPYFRDLLAEDSSYREWLVNVKAKKHAKGGQGVVHFFLGDPPPPQLAKLWPYTPYHVGAFVTLGQDTNTACENCRQAQADGLEVTGQVPLTIALAERYINKTIPDMNEATVVNYLKENLRWRTVLDNGSVIENQSDLDGLLVYVISQKVTVYTDVTVPPVYDDADIRFHPEITTRPDGENEGRGKGTGLTIQAFSHVPREMLSSE